MRCEVNQYPVVRLCFNFNTYNENQIRVFFLISGGCLFHSNQCCFCCSVIFVGFENTFFTSLPSVHITIEHIYGKQVLTLLGLTIFVCNKISLTQTVILCIFCSIRFTPKRVCKQNQIADKMKILPSIRRRAHIS